MTWPAGGCQFDGCDKPHHARGYCSGHYWQTRRGTEPHPLGTCGLDPHPVLELVVGQTSTALAQRFGVHDSLIRHWRTGRRHISRQLADRVALELGRHPSNLWPGQW